MKVVIVGAGKLGLKVANTLLGGDHDVTIIDTNEDILQKISSQMDVMTINANAKEIKVLKRINIASYDFMITTTGDDEENIVISAFAKSLGCKKAIARVRDPEHMQQISFIKEVMGIDHIVNPDLGITVEIYKYLAEKYTLSNGIFSSGKVSLIEFSVSRFKSLIGVEIPNVGEILPNMLIVAISRNGKVIIPHGDTTIQAGDALYVIGEKGPILDLNEKVHEKGKYNDLQKVMIIGGGKTCGIRTVVVIPGADTVLQPVFVSFSTAGIADFIGGTGAVYYREPVGVFTIRDVFLDCLSAHIHADGEDCNTGALDGRRHIPGADGGLVAVAGAIRAILV